MPALARDPSRVVGVYRNEAASSTSARPDVSEASGGRLDASKRPGAAKLRVEMTNCVGSAVYRVLEQLYHRAQAHGRNCCLLRADAPSAAAAPGASLHALTDKHRLCTRLDL